MSVDIQQVARTAARTCGLQPATDDVVSIAHLNLNAAGVVIDCQQDRWLRAIADPAAATALSLPIPHLPILPSSTCPLAGDQSHPGSPVVGLPAQRQSECEHMFLS